MKQSKLKKAPFWDNESKNLLIQKIEERLLEFGLSRSKQQSKYDKERFEGFSWSLVYGNIVKGNRAVRLETINDKDSYQKRLEELRELVEKELDAILDSGKILETNPRNLETI